MFDSHYSKLGPACIRLLAVVVPGAALWLATAGQGSERAAVSPFGWDRLMAVQVLSTLPASWMAAREIRRRLPRQGRGAAIAFAAVGIVVAVATGVFGSALGPLMDDGNAGTVLRLTCRVAWCFALGLPWCLTAEMMEAGGPTSRAVDDLPHRRHALATFALAVLVAAGPPAAYTAHLIGKQSTLANDLLQRQRLVRAEPVVAALRDVGSAEPLANQTPVICLRQLTTAISQIEMILAQPQASPSTTASTIERAAALTMLDRLTEATRLIKPLSAQDPQATLLLAAIMQQGENWQASTDEYRHALTLLSETSAVDAQSIAARVRAYNGIAFNARELKRYQEAEESYLEGLRLVPTAQAHFHFQLGRHYQLAGRPLKSAEHLQTAAQLDPTNYAKSAASIQRKLNLETPGCGIKPTWAPVGRPLSR